MEDNIKIYLKNRKGVDWIYLALYRVQWWAAVHTE
jgi:hypothetical protein